MDGWNTTFLLGRPIFRGELLVSGRVVVGKMVGSLCHSLVKRWLVHNDVRPASLVALQGRKAQGMTVRC